MPTVYVAEFQHMGLQTTGPGALSAVYAVPLVEQTVAITAGSVQSSIFNANTKVIRVHTDAICSIKVDTNPTASATTMRLAANQTEYFGVAQGKSQRIAVITNT